MGASAAWPPLVAVLEDAFSAFSEVCEDAAALAFGETGAVSAWAVEAVSAFALAVVALAVADSFDAFELVFIGAFVETFACGVGLGAVFDFPDV